MVFVFISSTAMIMHFPQHPSHHPRQSHVEKVKHINRSNRSTWEWHVSWIWNKWKPLVLPAVLMHYFKLKELNGELDFSSDSVRVRHRTFCWNLLRSATCDVTILIEFHAINRLSADEWFHSFWNVLDVSMKVFCSQWKGKPKQLRTFWRLLLCIWWDYSSYQ